MTAATAVLPLSQDADDIRRIVGAPTPYIGFNATRGKLPGGRFDAYKQMQSRIEHKACGSMRGTKARYVNAYGVDGTGPGAASTVTASIEYPLGTFNRVKFGGANSVVIPDAGFVDCDEWDFDIPDGAMFREWTWISNTIGVPYVSTCQNVDGSNGGTTTADLTAAGGAVAGSSAVYGAMAFIGLTTKPSVLMIGNSRDASLAQTGYGTNDIGVLSRGLSSAGGTVNLAIGGAAMWQYVLTSFAAILDLTQYCTHVAVGDPINDINGGDSVATLTTNYQSLMARWAKSAITATPAGGSPIYVSSITRSGTTATATVLSTAGLTTGQSVSIKGTSLAAYNVTATITVVNARTFTYTVAGSPATPAQGATFKKAFIRTCEPYATSTDNYATTTNQTLVMGSTKDAVRTAWNDKVRSGTLVGMTDFFDTADQVESARNSGFWKAGTVPLVGADGLHAVVAGELAMASAVNGARLGTTGYLTPLSLVA